MVILALLCGIVAQIGDLSFSLIKREFGIKDYGHLLPGARRRAGPVRQRAVCDAGSGDRAAAGVAGGLSAGGLIQIIFSFLE